MKLLYVPLLLIGLASCKEETPFPSFQPGEIVFLLPQREEAQVINAYCYSNGQACWYNIAVQSYKGGVKRQGAYEYQLEKKQ